LPGSPALDAGSNVLIPAGISTDQRGAGFPRVVNGTVDIGAFESPVFGNPTVYTVNLTSDTGASSGTDATTGTPSGDLLWAITQANANSNPTGSVIVFDPTVFNPAAPQTITLTSTLDLSEQPWPEVIQGPGANALTISGNNAVQVLHAEAGTTATVSGLTLTGGNGARDGQFNQGGGIENDGTLTVTGCTITKNTVNDGWGGGIINESYNGFLMVSDSIISDNSATGGDGGGIANFGVATITNSTITNNSAIDSGGGIANSAQTTVADSTIAGNVAVLGEAEASRTTSAY